jgi:hypothetical protein
VHHYVTVNVFYHGPEGTKDLSLDCSLQHTSAKGYQLNKVLNSAILTHFDFIIKSLKYSLIMFLILIKNVTVFITYNDVPPEISKLSVWPTYCLSFMADDMWHIYS